MTEERKPAPGDDHAPGDDPAPSGDPAPGRDRAPARDKPAVEIRVNDDGDASLLALIDRLAGLLDRSDLSELEVEAGGTGLILRRSPKVQLAAVVAAPAAIPADGAGGESSPAGRDGPPPRPSVKAPLTGIYYASPAPESPPYLKEGGEIAVGQVIGLIEAMKLFNEIKSDLAGRVVRIVAESGQLVKAKQPLVEVDPL
jgi:acetyl-CoA carboxylase biotin carboxyl carrier protein